jgi:ubiquinone/menaquinone biosynthesis C-methylase UbiE
VSQSESAAAWSAVAAGWERHEAVVSANSRPVTERLLERLDPKPGERILEIGAGVGEVGLLVADRVGPDGHVTITDQAEAMVEAVRRRSEDRPNVTAAVVDAQSLDLPAGSFDGIVSRFAYMLVPDLDAAFDGSRRVLRSGGRLVFAVWASAPENPWASTVGRALVELGHAEPPDPDAPGPFRLHDQERLRTLLTDAGFAEVGIEDVPLAMRYESFDDYWDVTRDLAMSLQEALGRLSADEAGELRSRVERAFERYATGEELALPALARVVRAAAR